MSDFSLGLSYDQKAMAAHCGVSFGWVNSREGYTGEQQVRASCKHCNIILEATWKEGLDEGEVERKLWEDFKKRAKEAGCQHVRKYEALQSPEHSPFMNGLAMLELFENPKKDRSEG